MGIKILCVLVFPFEEFATRSNCCKFCELKGNNLVISGLRLQRFLMLRAINIDKLSTVFVSKVEFMYSSPLLDCSFIVIYEEIIIIVVVNSLTTRSWSLVLEMNGVQEECRNRSKISLIKCNCCCFYAKRLVVFLTPFHFYI